jgi:hypothetical protein
MASPVGIRVPFLGSCCSKCVYLAPGGETCQNRDYIQVRFTGKAAGEKRFIDGKTGEVVSDPDQYCCNFFDWPGR